MANPLTNEERLELRKRRLDYCKKSSKFILTNVGLGLLMIVYTVVGAIVFQKLETTNEKELCTISLSRYEPMENQTANDLWSMATSYKSSEELEGDERVQVIGLAMREFKEKVMDLGYDGTNCSMLGEQDGPQYKWSFSGSLLFAVTVFTTVGYGNIAPKTFWGRLVCIVYAFIGIPLMLLFLANIGEVMADVFRFVYSKVCCCGCCDDRKSRDELSESKQTLSERSQQSLDESIDQDEDDSQLGVPLTITLTVVAGYLFMGALLFGTWERWSMLQSAYYCFITISTIGFGDVVPGTDNMNSATGQLTMIGAALYLIFGMAIMSMAFNLIQEEMVSKFVWISEKLGLSKKEEDEEYSLQCNQQVAPQGRGEPVHPGSGIGNTRELDANSLTKMATSAISRPIKK